MNHIITPEGVRISYDKYGRGPALVLVHGSFSDHLTNWEFVKPLLEAKFTVYAIARRGRGETDATEGHSLEDEANDVVALLRSIGQPVFLAGHSYGAQAALVATAKAPECVRKLILYEGPCPHIIRDEAFESLKTLARAGNWDDFSGNFFRDFLHVPADEIELLRKTPLWAPILADARFSLRDIEALKGHSFDPERYRGLGMPVLLQIGATSQRDLWFTDALAAVLPNAEIEEFAGQAHEAMTTAPGLYSTSLLRFLLTDGKPVVSDPERLQPA